jgi:hypothetical protein
MKTIDVATFCETINRDVTEMKSRALGITNDLVGMMGGNGEHGVEHSVEYPALLDFLGYVEKKLDSLAMVCSVELRETPAAEGYGRSGNALNWWFG